MLLNKINESPIVPVYYHDDIDKCKSVMSNCYDGGVRVFEFVDRGSKSKDNFEKLLHFKNENFKDVILGVGTIKNDSQAKAFIEIGAEFLVSPIVASSISAIAHAHSIPWIPGCMTPTEIARAEQLGHSIVKLFPGEVLGTSFLKSVRSIFPNLDFMITGGVSLSEDNLNSWFDAGATAVGVGSKLFEGEFDSSKNVVKNLKCAFDLIQKKNNL